jgi:hypothetical protein
MPHNERFLFLAFGGFCPPSLDNPAHKPYSGVALILPIPASFLQESQYHRSDELEI